MSTEDLTTACDAAYQRLQAARTARRKGSIEDLEVDQAKRAYRAAWDAYYTATSAGAGGAA